MVKLEIKEIENIQNRSSKVKNWHLEGQRKKKHTINNPAMKRKHNYRYFRD